MRYGGWVLVAMLGAGCLSENALEERTQQDNWFQAPNNEVDILWVVDNSCSMEEEQATLAAGFQSFVGQMEASGTDFQMGVISTSFDYDDPTRGVLTGDPPYLTNADDYVAEFVARSTGLGIAGSDKEKGLEAAAYALSPAMTFGGANDGFVRGSAALLVVFVSDEEDCSDRGALGLAEADQCYLQKEKLVPVYEFVQELRDLKGDDELVQVGSIVGVKNAACDDAYPGSRYIDLTKLMGGLVQDICLADWSDTLTELGLNATGVRTSFQTSYVAKDGTLVVHVDGEELPQDPVNGWTYDPTTCYLTFGRNAVPGRGAELAAEYTVAPGTCQ